MKWSEQAWQMIENLFEKIVLMPFNLELMNGTLPPEKFRFYIQQDAIYLAEFSRALALIAARSVANPYSLDFIQFAEGAIVVEKLLHQNYFALFGITAAPEASPTCQLYTQFLLTKAALDSVETAMAAVLPCFWIYKKTGDYIFTKGQTKNNPYKDWIDTYSGNDFAMRVEKAISICDDVAEQCSPSQQKRMFEAFIAASKMEWMFWNSAYNLEAWPC